MILFTCTIASFVAQKGAKNIALQEAGEKGAEELNSLEKILIPVSNSETTEELINLGITVKSRKNKNELFALSIIDNSTTDATAHKNARKILQKAAIAASATDNSLHQLLRYDQSVTQGIVSVVREQQITDLILGLHIKEGISDSFLGNLTENILSKSNTTTLIYKAVQPFGTIKRHIILVLKQRQKRK
ncbi:universal stress protein [Antarcticibacterium sp. 1MA-6-2]|uniref:universal stress protein n=1 Tax=Antarcticibacterium sp. 1MA-6-2 TaxID=2908210 RepID=UPI001F214DD6|nr:universal stress protein [Antarcticibacterium sp. 1MA-6-2]UJH92964.1 universal stress protein [Antarcticibacterium sp. 1MA-6-2]